MVLTWYDGHWYLTTVRQKAKQDLLGAEVTAVNGRSMEEVLEAFWPRCSAPTTR